MAAADLESRLDRAAATCLRQGGQLTELRRQVLGLVLDSEAPVGAYALLDRLRGLRGGAAPPTVYRALDFLLEHGLIHRVEKLNAFVGCAEAGHDHGHGDGHRHDHARDPGTDRRDHPTQFLICRRCGTAHELSDPAVTEALRRAAEGAGFAMARATVEIEGLCARCRADA
ncbi:transcriptional repressor [Roseomonas sp. NAR14]|uniref:Transcriptional repressor n=1 Tax=Roseomonas acroporae TaxID=2937791 RepID=A0A9X1Y5S8_9PROT|nr:transcriptional repressor [Roseomonas acroporae]MCK8784479.1 transcriptional repressor [Roseomonas acroporae]